MTRPTLITIIGKSAKDARDPVPEKALRMAEEVGRLVAERNGIVVTGGLSGVMEAVSRGAKSAGGIVIGILPGFDKRDANDFVDIAITTGMGWMRNTLTVRAADAVIMISGGIGTLNELTVAYELKPTVILEGTAVRITDRPTLLRLAKRYADQGWPASVKGEALTAKYSAPSAGPPPWNLYLVRPTTAFGVATAEPWGATRWQFESRGGDQT